METNDAALPFYPRLAPFVLAGLAFFWVLRSPINATGSDPRGSLLASQALLETGSLRLDDYVDETDLPSRNLVVHRSILANERRVDYSFPIGVPVAGLPAVWLARQFGLDMRRFDDEAQLHKWLAAISVALIVLLTAAMAGAVLGGQGQTIGPSGSGSQGHSDLGARRAGAAGAGAVGAGAVGSGEAGTAWGNRHKAVQVGVGADGEQSKRAGPAGPVRQLEVLTLTSVLVLGSGLVGNLGLAFWSNNLAALFNLAALLLLLRWSAAGQARELEPGRAALLGLILACSAVSRPSSALLGLLILLYLLGVHGPRTAFRTGLGLAAVALLFCTYSYLNYRSILPPYYRPSRLNGSSTFGIALFGNLISPGRGILLFAPWIGLTVVGLLRGYRRLTRQPLVLLAICWAGLHLLAISRFPHWWAGHSFGNRLFVEAMPALVLIAIFVWQDASERRGARVYRRLFLMLGVFAIWVHSWQALYNINTVRWNGGDWGPVLGDINIDKHPEFLWDWRHPQMLASEVSIADRYHRFQIDALPRLAPGDAILADADPRFFEGWHEVEGEPGSRWRWSEGRWEGPEDHDLPRIRFRLAPSEWTANEDSDAAPARLWLEAGSFQGQAAELWLNGHPLGSFQPPMHFDPLRQAFALPSGTLGESNVLEFRLPDAREAGGGDERILGLAFRSLMLESASQ